MKNTPTRAQRSFVVEYKSNRRQLKAGNKSIWGDTDLKALARAVTADMRDDVQVDCNPTTGLKDAHRALNLPAAEHHPPLLVAVDEGNAASHIVNTHEDPADACATPIVDGLASGSKRKRQTGTRKPKGTKKPSSPQASDRLQYLTFRATLSDDDVLSVLEIENRRLKELLMNKLRTENVLLKEMLRRVEAGSLQSGQEEPVGKPIAKHAGGGEDLSLPG